MELVICLLFLVLVMVQCHRNSLMILQRLAIFVFAVWLFALPFLRR